MTYNYYSNTPERAVHSTDPSVLREYVDRIKDRHGVSQRAQAEALGVGWTTYRDWLNGTAKWPKSAQIVLEQWASSPTESDIDAVARRCKTALAVAEEQRLIEAAQHIDDLPDTVRDWEMPVLLEFAALAEEDRRYNSAYDLPLFQETVLACLMDQETGEPIDFELSEPAKQALCEHAWDECRDAVMARLVKLLVD